ncbi:MAG: ferredoxin [Candidatus Omnitrophota bacterium]
MKAVVDPDICTGCGLCVSTCPEVFEMDGDVAKAIGDEVPEENEECAKQAEEDCPVQAIIVK